MIRHHAPFIPSLCAAAAFALAVCTPIAAHAGDPAAGKADETPADVVKTLSQVGDLDLLITLTPLHLNRDQIDKTVTLLESVKKDGMDAAKVNYTAIRALADDVDKTRASALTGTPPDDDVKSRIKKTLDAIDKRTTDSEAASAKRVATFLEANLTPEQITAIETAYAGWIGGKIKVPAAYKDDPDGQKAYVQQTALGGYADRILLTQRAIDLLRAMRAAAPAAPATTAIPAPAAAPAPAAPAAP